MAVLSLGLLEEVAQYPLAFRLQQLIQQIPLEYLPVNNDKMTIEDDANNVVVDDDNDDG